MTSSLALLRTDPRVVHVDDERAIGNSLIVTMAPGWTIDPLDPHHGVFGADTVAEAWTTLRQARRVDRSVETPCVSKALTTAPEWTDDELRTLIRFRARVGRRWKSTLADLYLAGRDDGEPEGAGLRRIRNRQGPSRVYALTGAALDAAEARLSREANNGMA